MNYNWFKVLSNSNDITQGDILTKAPIPVPNKSLFSAIIEGKDSVDEPIDIREADLIVLSQACDLANDKITTVVLCPVWELSILIEKIPHFKSSKAREELRKGLAPAYHLINEFSSESICIDYSVVDFQQIYTLPKDFLEQHAGTLSSRLRVLPPYREHLSQAFARYFMRVGLPIDIDPEKIKKYKDESNS